MDVIPNWEIHSLEDPVLISDYITNLTIFVQTSFESSSRPIHKYNSNHWWSKELRTLRNRTRASRRLYQRQKNDDLRKHLRQNYLILKRELCYAIRRAKLQSWKNLVNKYNKKWDKAFQIVFAKKKFISNFREIGNTLLDYRDPIKTLETF